MLRIESECDNVAEIVMKDDGSRMRIIDERPLTSITIGVREGALNRSLAHRNRANGRTQPLLYPFQGYLDPGHIPDLSGRLR